MYFMNIFRRLIYIILHKKLQTFSLLPEKMLCKLINTLKDACLLRLSKLRVHSLETEQNENVFKRDLFDDSDGTYMTSLEIMFLTKE